MSSILDHVEQAVPRATVYGAMKGSPVFIGKYFREINPASNAPSYKWSNGERRISFVVASPDKTIFNDLRSSYLRFDVAGVTAHGSATKGKISEPASNCIGRIVIKMNGTVIEDISDFDRLTSFFKRSLIKRNEKNARGREGWDYVANPSQSQNLIAAANIRSAAQLQIGAAIGDTTAADEQGNISAQINYGIVQLAAGVDLSRAATSTTGVQTFGAYSNNVQATEERGIKGDRLCVKLDMSGIFNVQQLLSGYYSPLEIDLYLQDPMISCSGNKTNTTNASACTDIEIKNCRLCMDQIVMSPEYVSAFEAALLANSSAQGIQIPFTTYYTYQQTIDGNSTDNRTTFWIRRPVRYLKGVYFGAYPSEYEVTSADSYRPCRVYPNAARTGDRVTDEIDIITAPRIASYRFAVGTKNYREVDDIPAQSTTAGAGNFKFHCNESQVQFSKAVGHQNDYATESDEFNAAQKVLNNAVQGIDLEFSPDNDVLASETTLNSNDVRLEIRTQIATGDVSRKYKIYSFLQYQASIALFPGNETRLLVT